MKQTLRYNDSDYLEKCFTSGNAEGIDYPYICQKCGKFLDNETVELCADADYVLINGIRYDWVCKRCLK